MNYLTLIHIFLGFGIIVHQNYEKHRASSSQVSTIFLLFSNKHYDYLKKSIKNIFRCNKISDPNTFVPDISFINKIRIKTMSIWDRIQIKDFFRGAVLLVAVSQFLIPLPCTGLCLA